MSMKMRIIGLLAAVLIIAALMLLQVNPTAALI